MTRPRLTLVLLAAAAALTMSACAGLPGGAGSAGHEILQNLQGCDRHYEGAIGAGVNGSFRIDCKAQPSAAAAPQLLVVPADEDPGLAASPANPS